VQQLLGDAVGEVGDGAPFAIPELWKRGAELVGLGLGDGDEAGAQRRDGGAELAALERLDEAGQLLLDDGLGLLSLALPPLAMNSGTGNLGCLEPPINLAASSLETLDASTSKCGRCCPTQNWTVCSVPPVNLPG